MPGFINSDNVQDGIITPAKLSTKLRKYSFCTFQAQGSFTAPNGYGAPTGTANDTNRGSIPCDVGGVLPIDYHIKGTQTLLAPSFTLTGLDVSLDQTDNDGAEYVFGGNTIRGKHAYVIGGPGFFARLKFKLSDVSGTDDCAFGFRKVQAFTANLDDNTDAALLNVILGDIKIETILNNAATVTVDTTQDWADAATHTLDVEVNQGGVARFQIDAAAPVVGKSNYTFDATDVVVPVLFFLQATTAPGTCELLEFESGYLPRRRV